MTDGRSSTSDHSLARSMRSTVGRESTTFGFSIIVTVVFGLVQSAEMDSVQRPEPPNAVRRRLLLGLDEREQRAGLVRCPAQPERAGSENRERRRVTPRLTLSGRSVGD